MGDIIHIDIIHGRRDRSNEAGVRRRRQRVAEGPEGRLEAAVFSFQRLREAQIAGDTRAERVAVWG